MFTGSAGATCQWTCPTTGLHVLRVLIDCVMLPDVHRISWSNMSMNMSSYRSSRTTDTVARQMLNSWQTTTLCWRPIRHWQLTARYEFTLVAGDVCNKDTGQSDSDVWMLCELQPFHINHLLVFYSAVNCLTVSSLKSRVCLYRHFD